MLASLLGFGALLVVLAVVDWRLLTTYARRGPGNEFLPDPPPPTPSTVDSAFAVTGS
jgi:hypothetical protein